MDDNEERNIYWIISRCGEGREEKLDRDRKIVPVVSVGNEGRNIY
jgi:hypothetical protein